VLRHRPQRLCLPKNAKTSAWCDVMTLP
jgi:hypothetical protein